MAVRAHQRKVIELGLRAFDERLHGLSVVRLDETSAPLTVTILEVEVACFATEPPELADRSHLALAYEFFASLSHAMKSCQKAALFGLCDALIISGSWGTKVTTLQQHGFADRIGDLG